MKLGLVVKKTTWFGAAEFAQEMRSRSGNGSGIKQSSGYESGSAWAAAES